MDVNVDGVDDVDGVDVVNGVDDVDRSLCYIYINLCPTSLAKIVPGMALKALPECREVELRHESTYRMFHKG